MYNNIYIHIGLPKTGSTYLQNCLRKLNHEGLLINTDYPALNGYSDNLYQINSGNGEQIARMLVSHLTPEFDLLKLNNLVCSLMSIESPKGNLVISSEIFSSADPDRFNCFIDLIDKYSQNVTLILVVRNVYEYANSSYNQLVKRHALSISYGDYCENYFISQLSDLLTRISSYNVEKVCIPYSNEKLLNVFLDHINESIDSYDEFSFNANRSLTRDELDLLVKINSIYGSESICTNISNAWINACPYPNLQTNYLNSESLVKLVNDYKKNVELELAKLMLSINDMDSPSLQGQSYLNKNSYEDIVFLAFKVINDYYESKSIENYISQLDINKTNFDPIHYLLLNPDVVKAKIDPVEHFIKFGKKEGRYTSFDMLQISVPR